MRWGLLGVGNITADFCNAARGNPAIRMVACCPARPKSVPPEDYARSLAIPKAYSSAEELLEDPEIDIVYVGARTSMHFECAMKALRQGKAVLCEKPLTTTLDETRQLVAESKKRKVFLAEAFWTRYFPAVLRVQELIREGAIGELTTLNCDHSVEVPYSEDSRMFKASQGGGTMYDLGCYAALMPTAFFRGERPTNVQSAINWDYGVDVSGSIAMTYPEGKVAAITFGAKSHTPCECTISGTKGSLRLKHSFHCPTTLEITEWKSRTDRPVRTEVFPHPPVPQVPESWKHNDDSSEVQPYPFHYPGGEGLLYEANGVDKAVSDGLIESPYMTHDESLILAEITEKVLAGRPVPNLST